VLARTFDGRLKPLQRQKTSRRLWRSVDFRPQHLHAVYDVYVNRIVDRYLDPRAENGAAVLSKMKIN
jgi:hypothetical protein